MYVTHCDKHVRNQLDTIETSSLGCLNIIAEDVVTNYNGESLFQTFNIPFKTDFYFKKLHFLPFPPPQIFNILLFLVPTSI